MENTPPASVSDNTVKMTSRAFGGKFTDLCANTIVKHDIHQHEVVRTLASSFAEVELLELSVFATTFRAGMAANLRLYLAWGHCEHAMPNNLAEMAQLPAFTVMSFADGSDLSAKETTLGCPLGGPIATFIKPVHLYGGRPSLYAYAEATFSDEVGKKNPAVVQLFFRAKVRTAGSDIIIV